MEIKRGQVWRNKKSGNLVQVVPEPCVLVFTSPKGELVAEHSLVVFEQLYEPVATEDAQMIKPKHPSSIRNKGLEVNEPKEIIVKADKFTINDVEVDEAWINARIKERVGVVHPKENVLKKHHHYFKDVSDYKEIDVYALCKIFEIDDPSGCTQHAIKKLLVTGKRGHKDRLRDLQDVVDTVKRLIELESSNE